MHSSILIVIIGIVFLVCLYYLYTSYATPTYQETFSFQRYFNPPKPKPKPKPKPNPNPNKTPSPPSPSPPSTTTTTTTTPGLSNDGVNALVVSVGEASPPSPAIAPAQTPAPAPAPPPPPPPPPQNRSGFFKFNQSSIVKLLASLGIDLNSKKNDVSINNLHKSFIKLFYRGSYDISTTENMEKLHVTIKTFMDNWSSKVQPIQTLSNLQPVLNDFEHIFSNVTVNSTNKLDIANQLIDVFSLFKAEFASVAKSKHTVVVTMMATMKKIGVDTENELVEILSLMQRLQFTGFNVKPTTGVSFVQFITDMNNRGLSMKSATALNNISIIQSFGYTANAHSAFTSTLSQIGLTANTNSAGILGALGRMGVKYNTYTDFLQKTFQQTGGKFSSINMIPTICDTFMRFGVYYKSKGFQPSDYTKFIQTTIVPIIDHVKATPADISKMQSYATNSGAGQTALQGFQKQLVLSDNAIYVVLSTLQAIGINNLQSYRRLFTTLNAKFTNPTIHPYLFNPDVRRFFEINVGDEYNQKIYNQYMNRVATFAHKLPRPDTKHADVDVYLNYIRNNNLTHSQVSKNLGRIEDININSDAVYSDAIHAERVASQQGFTTMFTGWGEWFFNLFQSSQENFTDVDDNITKLLLDFGINDANKIQKGNTTINTRDFISILRKSDIKSLDGVSGYLHSLMGIDVDIANYFNYTQLLRRFEVPPTDFKEITRQFHALKLVYSNIPEFLEDIMGLGVRYSMFIPFLEVLAQFGLTFDGNIAYSTVTNVQLAFGFLKYMKLAKLYYHAPHTTFQEDDNPFVNAIGKMRQLVTYVDPTYTPVMIDEFVGHRSNRFPVPLINVITTCLTQDHKLRDFRKYNPNDNSFQYMDNFHFIPETLIYDKKNRMIPNVWNNGKYTNQENATNDYNQFIRQMFPRNVRSAKWVVDLISFQACMTTEQFDNAVSRNYVSIEHLLGKLKPLNTIIDGALQQSIVETWEGVALGMAKQNSMKQFKSSLLSINLCILFPHTTLKYVNQHIFAKNDTAEQTRAEYMAQYRCERNLYAHMSNADRARCQNSGYSTTETFTGYAVPTVDTAFTPTFTPTILPVQRDTGISTGMFDAFTGRPQYQQYI